MNKVTGDYFRLLGADSFFRIISQHFVKVMAEKSLLNNRSPLSTRRLRGCFAGRRKVTPEKFLLKYLRDGRGMPWRRRRKSYGLKVFTEYI